MLRTRSSEIAGLARPWRREMLLALLRPPTLALVLVGLMSQVGAHEPTMRSIGGVAVDAQGEPLVDAEIRVMRGSRLVLTTSTDARGRFLAPLDMDATVDVAVGKRVDEWDASGQLIRRSLLAAFVRGVPIGTLDLRLAAAVPKLRTIDAHVVVSNSAGPMAGARVLFLPTPLLSHEGSARTDQHGKATIRCGWSRDEGPPGVLVVPPDGWAPAVVDAAPLDGSAISITVHAARVVSGRLVDAAGVPAPAVGVLPVGNGGGTAIALGDVSGSDGRFQVAVPAHWRSFELRVGSQEPFPHAPCLLSTQVVREEAGEFADIEVRLATAALPSPPEANVADLAEGRERHAVCNAVLRHAHAKDDTPGLVLATRDGNLPWLLGAWTSFGSHELRAISAVTRQDFALRNAHRSEAPRGLRPGVRVLLVSTRWLEHLFVRGGASPWERFHERFAGFGGLLELSAVGFNEQRTQAMVRVGRAVGYLAGSGTDYLLEKRDGVWHVVGESVVWVS